MGHHRRGIASVLAVIVGAPFAAAFAPPPTAQADGTGADHTVIAKTTSSGSLSAPTPPSDIVGRPAASLVLRTDDLMITKTVAHTGVGSRWAQVAPDLGGYAAQGDQGTQDLRDRLEPYLVTRSARLLDPQAERTLSLQHSAAGSDGLWQLSSLNAAAEPDWQKANKTDAVDANPGGTYTLSLNGTASVSAQPPPAGFDKPLATAPTSPTAARQQWTFQADPAGTGYLRLLNRSDGLCLRPLTTNPAQNPAVGSQPCSDAFADTELWRPDLVGTSTNSYAFTNKASGTVLTTSNLEGGELSTSPRGTAGSSTLKRQTFRLVQIVEPGGTIPTWSAGSTAQAGLPGALATGDLDRSANAAGQYGDEAVVAYIGSDHQLQVRVIDYNANESHLLATAPSGTLPQIGATVDGTWYPGSVGVAIGDFDGDLLNEVAVTWQNASGFHATILKYAQADDGSRTLTVVSPDLALQAKGAAEPSLVTGLAETTSGDFDGDRSDDVAIGFVAPDTNGQPTVWAGVTSFTDKDTVEAEAQAKVFSAASIFKALVPAAGVTWTARQLHAVAGLFRMDTASGRTMHRRQLEIVWTNSESDLDGNSIAFVHAVGFEVGRTAATSKLALSPTAVANLGWSPDPNAALSQPLSVATGGFAGRGKADAIPTWGLAVAGQFMKDDAAPDDAPRTAVRLFRFGSDGLPKPTAFLDEGDAGVPVEVTAYDRSGTSIVLGAPVVMTVDQYVRANLIAAQPPAHADWLDGRFVNISRTPDFAVTLGSGSSASYSFTHTTKASTTLGVSEGFDSTTTVKAGLFGFASTGGSLEVTQKFGEDWESDQVDTSKYSTTITQSEKATGTDDDLIDGLVVTNTVYRYPILGGALTTTDGTRYTDDNCKTNCYGYYEVTIPGAVTQINSPGRDDDWYQPSWQNGNALSYPKLSNGQVPISDMGSYSYVDDNGKTVTQTGTLFNQTNDLGGGTSSYDLELDSSVGGTHERTSSGSMTNSQELKTGVKIKFSVGVAKSQEDISASAGVTEGSTWATTDTGTTQTKTSSTFGLNVPALSETKAYRVGTAYYTDNAGTQKVVHGVDLTASAQGSEWWMDNYGHAPDLALNLPLSMTMTKNDLGVYGTPMWSSLNNRQRIRGFWAEVPADPDAPAISGVPYAENPQAGDPVVFAVQVHNYSLKAAPAAPVQFSAVPVNDEGKVIGPPTVIGTTSTPALDAQGIATIYSPTWTAVGPSSGTGLQDYRIFVVLDPDDRLHEIHPLTGQPPCPEDSIEDGSTLDDPMTGEPETLSCGQNNQGYGEVTVMGAGLPGGHRHSQGKVALNGASLLLGGRHAQPPTSGGTPQVIAGQLVQGFVHAKSTADNSRLSQVFVYDGAPSKGKLIAHAKLSGVDGTDGGSAEYTWQPTTPGRHVLYQVLSTGDGAADQVQKVTVEVLSSGEATRLALVPASTSTTAGSSVEYHAWTVDRWGNRVRDVTRNATFTITPDGTCGQGVCRPAEVGVHTVKASYRGFKGASTLTVTPSVAVHVAASGGVGQAAAPGIGYAAPLQVTVTDSAGSPVRNADVEFRLRSGSATFPGGETVATVKGDASGIATSPAVTAGPNAGPVVITATSGTATTSLPLSVTAPGEQRADLEVKVKVPKTVKVGRTVKVRFTVTNRGSARSAASALWLGIPAATQVQKAQGGVRVGSSVLFDPHRLKAGRSKSWTVSLKLTTRGKVPLTAIVVTGSDRRYSNNVRTVVLHSR